MKTAKLAIKTFIFFLVFTALGTSFFSQANALDYNFQICNDTEYGVKVTIKKGEGQTDLTLGPGNIIGRSGKEPRVKFVPRSLEGIVGPGVIYSGPIPSVCLDGSQEGYNIVCQPLQQTVIWRIKLKDGAVRFIKD